VQPTALVTTRIAATELFNESARSLHLVVGQSYYLNLNARLQMQAMQLAVGNVTYLDPAEAERPHGTTNGPGNSGNPDFRGDSARL
jgi:hypothetical protein